MRFEPTMFAFDDKVKPHFGVGAMDTALNVKQSNKKENINYHYQLPESKSCSLKKKGPYQITHKEHEEQLS